MLEICAPAPMRVDRIDETRQMLGGRESSRIYASVDWYDHSPLSIRFIGTCDLAIAQTHAAAQGHSLPNMQPQAASTSLHHTPGDWKFGLVWLKEDAL